MKRTVMSLWLPVIIFSCAPVQGRKDLLDFIADGSTTKEDAYLNLGAPSVTYQGERILVYRLGHNDSGYYLVTGASKAVESPYSLVLAFGEDGKLRRHSVVDVHPE